MSSVLIIDDDESLRDALRRTLHKEGYTIVEASDGLQGLKQLKSVPVDLVILDIFMPGKEGLETLREFRRLYPNLRVIAMSGGGSKGSLDVLKWAKLLGARQTLEKPFSREQLLDAVRKELPSHQPRSDS
jgi:DNA-binding NtrC family response regulator